jgi:hypothetical protein
MLYKQDCQSAPETAFVVTPRGLQRAHHRHPQAASRQNWQQRPAIIAIDIKKPIY